MKTTKSLCTDLSYHYTNSLVLHEWLQYYISITEGLAECLHLLLYLNELLQMHESTGGVETFPIY